MLLIIYKDDIEFKRVLCNSEESFKLLEEIHKLRKLFPEGLGYRIEKRELQKSSHIFNHLGKILK
jgi:hypothetical protein